MLQPERCSPIMAKRTFTAEIVDGIFWQGLAVGANTILRAVILILLARSIGAVAFGIVAAATVVTSITERFSQIGVARVLVQRLKLTKGDVKNAFAISLLTGLLATGTIFAAARLFASLFGIPPLTPVLQFLSLTLLLNNLANVPTALMQRERRFKALGMVEMGSYIFGFGMVALPMAWMGYGTWSLAMAQMAQVGSKAVALFALRPPMYRLWPDWRRSGTLLNDGSGFSFGQVGNFVAVQIDNFIVGRWLGAEALGFYSRAYQFLMLPAQLLGNAISTVLFPSIAAIQDQPERVARAYLRALGVIAMLTLPTSGVMLLVAPELVRFLLGESWEPMTLAFQILVATLLFRTSYKISDAVTMAMGSMFRRAWRQWVYAGAVVAGGLVGTRWGIAGVSVGVGAAVICNFVLMLNLARSVLPLDLGQIVWVHLRQLGVAVLVTLPTWGVVTIVRVLVASDLAVLLAAGIAAGSTWAVLWFRYREIFGEDGAWLYQQLMAKVGGPRPTKMS